MEKKKETKPWMKTNHVVEENADDDREKKERETRGNGMRKTEVGAEKWRTQKGIAGTKRRF